MKFGLKKWLSAMCVMGLFLAFGLTASAGSQPTISVTENVVSVTHDDSSRKGMERLQSICG